MFRINNQKVRNRLLHDFISLMSSSYGRLSSLSRIWPLEESECAR